MRPGVRSLDTRFFTKFLTADVFEVLDDLSNTNGDILVTNKQRL